MASGVSLSNFIPVKLTSINLVLIFLISYKFNYFSYAKREETDGRYGTSYSITPDLKHEFYYNFSGSSVIYPARIYMEVENASRDYPVFIEVTQNKYMSAWQLPVVVEVTDRTKDYGALAHTVYAVGINKYAKDLMVERKPQEVSNPCIQIRTKSPTPVSVNLTVITIKDFILKLDDNKTVDIDFNKPVYYYYNFNDQPVQRAKATKPTTEAPSEASENNNTVVQVKVMSNSTSCMSLSIQNTTGEIWDTEETITRDKHWQVLTHFGGMILTKQDYPNGFFVVLLLMKSNKECLGFEYNVEETKTVTINVKSNLMEHSHIVTILATLGIFVFVCLMIILACILILYFTIKLKLKRKEKINVVEDFSTPCLQYFCIPFYNTENTTNYYAWLVLITLVIYVIPVIQHIYSYHEMVSYSDNQCFYNFLCTWPLKFMNKTYLHNFNHVWSNIGYIAFGMCFMILTYLKQIWDIMYRIEGHGVPKLYSLYYACGIAMIMGGFLSAAYNICPREINYHLTTCFLQIVLALTVLNFYQVRLHNNDTVFASRRTFGVFLGLAGLTVICVIEPYVSLKPLMWIVLLLVHICIFSVLTYIMEKPFHVYAKKHKKTGRLKVITKMHIIMTIIIMLVNLLMDIVAFYMFEEYTYTFTSHFMLLMTVNYMYYIFFYIFMKRLHNERNSKLAGFLFGVDILCWVIAYTSRLAIIFTGEKFSSGARNFHQECILAGYYDQQDIWHFSSSLGLFLTCCVMLVVDDDLNTVPTSNIPNFHDEIKILPTAPKTSEESKKKQSPPKNTKTSPPKNTKKKSNG